MELGTAIGLLCVILGTFAFEGMVYGDALTEESFGTFGETTSVDCESGGTFGCVIDFITQVFQGIIGGIAFLFNLLSFNIPDAPIWIRFVLVGVLDGGLVLLIVSILRGN